MSNPISRWLSSDVGYSFRQSKTAMVAAFIAFVFIFCALFAKWVAPYNPFDAASLELMDSLLPPAWSAEGSTKYLLGTDDQGRDILSALMYGTRISLVVGMASVMLSLVVGVSLGLIAGFRGGWLDAFLMRLCDVMLSFPGNGHGSNIYFFLSNDARNKSDGTRYILSFDDECVILCRKVGYKSIYF